MAFHVGYGDWIRLLRENAFWIEDLIEIQPQPDATSRFEGLSSADWSQRWPSEEIWKARKRA